MGGLNKKYGLTCAGFAGLMLWAGCSYQDEFHTGHHVRDPALHEKVRVYLEQNPGVSDKLRQALLDREIQVGMTKPQVELLGGSDLDKFAPHTWKLKNQFSVQAWDLRAVYIYFGYWDELVKGIVLRGSFMLWP